MAKTRHSKPLKKKEENKDGNGVDPGGEKTEHLKPSIDLKNRRLCRLCESKEEPFVNIFDTEKVSKQIENLIPFTISKTDGLPDTVCLRCVTKVDEFHEFIDKSLKTHENLHNMLGKNPPVVQTKSKERIWSLMATNKSHEDICDAGVKMAMQAIIINGDTCPPNDNTNTHPISTAQPMTKVGESPKLTNANTASTKAQQMPIAVASPKLTNANTASTTKAQQTQPPSVEVPKPKLIFAPQMIRLQLKALYSENSYTFIPYQGNKFLLQKKKTPETDNSPEKVTKANRPQKTRTVTSATVSGASGTADPYPVALLRKKKSPAAVPKPEIQTKEYTCNVCCEKFNRQQKFAAHLKSHFQDDMGSSERKRIRRK